MQFSKGMSKPVGSGIKKGQKHVKNMVRNSVKDILIGINKHPVPELIKLLSQLEPKDQARVWMELLKYVSPQLTSVEVTDGSDEPEEETIDVTPMTNDELLAIANGSTEGTT